MNTQIEQCVDSKVANNDYDVSGCVSDATRDDLRELAAYCVIKYNSRIESIVLDSFAAFRSFGFEDWKVVVANTKAQGDFYLRKLLDFMLIYCWFDLDLLQRLGIPDDLAKFYYEHRADPKFEYSHPSEGRRSSARQSKINGLKREALTSAGLTDEDEFRLFRMFAA